jgi:hypothetical protein
MPSASTLTRRPAPGLLRLGFRAWRSVYLEVVSKTVWPNKSDTPEQMKETDKPFADTTA